jgi:hypothetical protein
LDKDAQRCATDRPRCAEEANALAYDGSPTSFKLTSHKRLPNAASDAFAESG